MEVEYVQSEEPLLLVGFTSNEYVRWQEALSRLSVMAAKQEIFTPQPFGLNSHDVSLVQSDMSTGKVVLNNDPEKPSVLVRTRPEYNKIFRAAALLAAQDLSDDYAHPWLHARLTTGLYGEQFPAAFRVFAVQHWQSDAEKFQ